MTLFLSSCHCPCHPLHVQNCPCPCQRPSPCHSTAYMSLFLSLMSLTLSLYGLHVPVPLSLMSQRVYNCSFQWVGKEWDLPRRVEFSGILLSPLMNLPAEWCLQEVGGTLLSPFHLPPQEDCPDAISPAQTFRIQSMTVRCSNLTMQNNRPNPDLYSI